VVRRSIRASASSTIGGGGGAGGLGGCGLGGLAGRSSSSYRLSSPVMTALHSCRLPRRGHRRFADRAAPDVAP
jgi:hypothetical protein